MKRLAGILLALVLSCEPTSAYLLHGSGSAGGGSGNLPASAFVVNFGSSTVTNPQVRLPQTLGDSDLSAGHVLNATVSGSPMTFTPARVASGQAGTPAFVDIMGILPASIPGNQTLSSLTSTSGSVATGTTPSPHGLTAGVSWIVINGAAQPGYDGLFLVQSTPTSTTFTYNMRQCTGNSVNVTCGNGSAATGTPVMYNAAKVVLNSTSGTWNTTLPAGKTAAQIVADIQAHMDDVGLTFGNVVTMGAPGNNTGNVLGSGNWIADANWGFNQGTTPSETGYYRVVAQGPSSMDIEIDVPLVDQTTYTPSAFTVSGGIGTVTVGNDLVSGGAFTGSISGTTLTISAIGSAIVNIGQNIVTSGGATAQITAFGTGTGGNGTYTLSANLGTVGSGTINVASQWVKFSGFTPSACNGFAQVASASATSFTYAAPAGCTTPSVIGTMQVMENSLWDEIHETAWLNTSTGAVTAIQFEQFLNQGKRNRQGFQANGNLAETLNGTVVRGFGGYANDNRTFTSVSPSAVNTTTDTITLTGNTFVNGQSVTVGCTGVGCSVPSPLVAANTPITSLSLNTSNCPGSSTMSFLQVTATLNNNFNGSNGAQHVLISGASPDALNGLWMVVSATSSTFTWRQPCGPSSVTSAGNVTPFYYVSNVANGSTIKLWSAQDGGNRQDAGTINLTTQGSGTLQIQSNTTIYPFTRQSLADVDGGWDWDTGTGALNGEPTVYTVQDNTYCRKAWRCPPLDLSIVMATPSEASPPQWAPDTFCGQDPGINTGGYDPQYGTPFNEWQARRYEEPWDRTGYVQHARVCALAQGSLQTWTWDTDYRVFAVNGSPHPTYSGIGTYSLSNRVLQGQPVGFWSTDFPVPVQFQNNTLTWINEEPEVTHWPMNTVGNYILEGGAPAYNQLLTEANAMALSVTFNYGSFNNQRNFTPASCNAGNPLWVSVSEHEVRSALSTFTLATAGELFTADGTGEKSFFNDELSDDIVFYNCVTAASTAANSNAATGNYMYWDVAVNGPPAGTFSNITTGGSFYSPGAITGSAPTEASSSSSFENSFVTLSRAYDYGLWPSSGMAQVAQQSDRFVGMEDTTWSCQAAIGAYEQRFVSPGDWDQAGSTSNNWIAPANVAFQPIGIKTGNGSPAGGVYFSADGSHIVFLSTEQITPQFISGADRIVFEDSDYEKGEPWGGFFTSGAQPLPTGPTVATGTGAPVFNTFYHLQNVGTSATKSNWTATLSTDAAGLSPVTWSGVAYGSSTLNGSITSGATSISLNSAILIPNDGAANPSILPGTVPLLVQIDSELIPIKANTAGSVSASISGTVLTVNSFLEGGSGIAVGNIVAGPGVPAGTVITSLGTGTGGTGTYNINNSATIASERMLLSGTTLTVASTGRGAYGTTAASHSSGATVQLYIGANYFIDLQNRTGVNCPSQLIQGGHSSPAYSEAGSVQQGYFVSPWAATAYYTFYGLPLHTTTAAFNRMNTLLATENNIDGCHGLTGFATCNGGTLQYSASPSPRRRPGGPRPSRGDWRLADRRRVRRRAGRAGRSTGAAPRPLPSAAA